jgi:hypothetical protein
MEAKRLANGMVGISLLILATMKTPNPSMKHTSGK